MRAIFTLIACGLLLPAPGGAQPSGREWVQMPADEAAPMIRRDLESLLLFDQAVRDRRRGDSVGIPGRPFHTRVPGLCQRTYVHLGYTYARPPLPSPQVLPGGRLSGPREDPRDIPLRPLHVGTEQQYHFVAAPGPATQVIGDRQAWDSAAAAQCPVGLTARRGWFASPQGEFGALSGWHALQRASSAVAAGAIAVECEPGTAPDHTTCAAELQRISTDPHALIAIRTSWTGDEAVAELEIDDYTVTMHAAHLSANPAAPIRSVRMGPRPVVIRE